MYTILSERDIQILYHIRLVRTAHTCRGSPCNYHHTSLVPPFHSLWCQQGQCIQWLGHPPGIQDVVELNQAERHPLRHTGHQEGDCMVAWGRHRQQLISPFPYQFLFRFLQVFEFVSSHDFIQFLDFFQTQVVGHGLPTAHKVRIILLREWKHDKTNTLNTKCYLTQTSL